VTAKIAEVHFCARTEGRNISAQIAVVIPCVNMVIKKAGAKSVIWKLECFIPPCAHILVLFLKNGDAKYVIQMIESVVSLF
jgi:hypothetical protein